MSLRIGYINVNGFGYSKLQACRRLLTSVFDILFVSEHWYIDHEKRMQEPDVFYSTPFTGYPEMGHAHGGILCMATLSHGPRMTHIQSSANWLSIKIENITVTAVYWPPRIVSTDQFATGIESLPLSDCILGDWNVRFPHICDKTSGHMDRLITMNKWMEDYDMHLVLPVVVS